jgi:hypothetical protein
MKSFFKSGRQDSNLRPPGPKPGALPACATSRNPPHMRRWIESADSAVREGFEPSVHLEGRTTV